MASLSTTEKKKQGNRFRSDSDAITLPEAVANPLRDYILESARTIHRTELTMAFLRWMLSVVAVFFSLVLIDQWLWPLSTVARYVVWVGFIGGTVLWFTTMVLPLIGRTIHPHYAARQIETTLPEMKEGLITWVQLSGSDTPPPKSVLNAVGRYVAKQLKGQDIASVIDQLNPLKLAAALMGLTLIGAIYLATSPKNVPATIQRLLMPWANIAPATRVQIVSVTPGDTSVIQGSNALIAIQVRGWQRQDKATVRYATDDGQTVDQRVAMTSDIEGLSYRIELGKSFGGILQPMHYWVEAGDAIAGPFAIQVQAIPLSTLERVDYVYPAYTRMSPRTIESDGRIEGPEGTRVRVTAKGNQPMKSARVEFDSTLAQDGSYQPEWIRDLQVDDRSISGDWILEVNEKRSNPSHYQYRIRSTNMLGESAPEPVVYPMTVVADMAPEVDFAAEIKDIIEVAENSSIDLEMRASDPDFGLVMLVLDGTSIGSKNRGSVLQETLLEDAAGLTGQSVHTLSVAPKQLGLQSGDKIDLVLTASDNRHDPQTSKPAPNVVKSRIVTLKVTPPVNNPNPTDDASGGKQNDPSTDPSKSDDTPKSKSPSDPQQPNKKTSKENPDNSNEKPSGEQKPNKQDQSKQASDQANSDQKEDTQRNKEIEQTPSQPKSTPNQPKDNATGQPQDKDQPPRDQQQLSDNKKPEQQQPKNSNAKDQSSKEQSGKEQSGEDQSGKDQDSGDDPSGASKASDSSGGQPQGSQNSAGGKSGGQSSDSSGNASNDSPNDASGEPSGAQSQGAQGAGKESSSGSQSSGMKSDPSNPNDSESSGSKADPSESNAADGDASAGDASDGQAPTHDGEAFERLQKILNPSKSNDGANGKPTSDQGPSEDKAEPMKDPQSANSGKPSGDQSKTNKSPEKAPDKSSNQDNPTDQKSGDSSSEQSGNKQQPGDPRDASASDGNKSGSQSSNSQPSSQKKNSDNSKSDNSKSNTAKSDSAQSNSDDKSKSNESSGGDNSKAATDKSNPNQSKTSPNNNVTGEDSTSGQDSKPNDSKSNDLKANESNSKQGRDKSEGGMPNNAKPENSDAKNSQSESNKSESNESGGSQPISSNSESSDTAGSNSKSGQSGEKGSSSDSSKQDAANSSSSKSNEVNSTKGNSIKSDPSKGDSKSSEGKSQDASSKGPQSEGSGHAKGSSGQSKSSSGSNKSSGASAGGSQGMNSSGESGTSAGSDAGGNESSASSSKETTEYAKSATDLVLDSLKRQREQPDPELLKRMGWNKEQMQAFVDRWQAARDQAMIDPSKKKDYEDMLQSLGLVPQTGNTRAVLGRTDGLTGIREEGSRVRPPESLRERFEAFRKASQQPGTK